MFCVLLWERRPAIEGQASIHISARERIVNCLGNSGRRMEFVNVQATGIDGGGIDAGRVLLAHGQHDG
jgi:hypothetical protein